MDYGLRWPWFVRLAIELALVFAAGRFAFRASCGHPLRGAALALGSIAITIAVWLAFDRLCMAGANAGVDLPECSWEYIRAPERAGPLAAWLIAGSLFRLLVYGPPIAALSAGLGILRGYFSRRGDAHHALH